jgi:hypothetical protein
MTDLRHSFLPSCRILSRFLALFSLLTFLVIGTSCGGSGPRPAPSGTPGSGVSGPTDTKGGIGTPPAPPITTGPGSSYGIAGGPKDGGGLGGLSGGDSFGDGGGLAGGDELELLTAKKVRENFGLVIFESPAECGLKTVRPDYALRAVVYSVAGFEASS